MVPVQSLERLGFLETSARFARRIPHEPTLADVERPFRDTACR